MKTALALAAALLATAAYASPGMPSPPAAGAVQGEVLETKDVDSYTYLRLKTASGETWAAVPKSAVKKGQHVTLANTMVMDNFESKTLKRKFDHIVFGTIAGPDAKAVAPLAAPAGPPHGAMPAPSLQVAKVAKAPGPEGRTVAEVVAGKAALKGKPVVVRGQVVKVNNGIMGKNWVHLQDGSGSAAKSDNDLLVTTQDKVVVGDVVSAKGTVRTDVNLGSGYAYAVLVEDAAIRK
jgi:hypothetical protein